MRKTSRLLCVFLCITLLFLSVFAPDSYAYSPQMRVVTSGGGSSVNMRVAANQNSAQVCPVPSGSIVEVHSQVNGTVAISGNGTVWYNVTYNDKTGYIYGKFLADIKQYFDPDFEKNLSNFPESYREPLRAIHYQYPNWQFVAEYVDMSLDTAINYEYSQSDVTQTRKWVDVNINNNPAWIDSRVNMNDSTYIKESHWTFASRNAIAFFMDPRNALTDKNTVYYYPNIFQFLQHTYDPSTQTVDGLRLVIKNTFLEKGYDGNQDAYVNDIMQATAESGVSPYVIAALIKIEQGTNGTSDLISGTYTGYESYYNFFNYGATGDNVIVNGLTRAISEGWSSRNASIVGGSKLYRKYYVDRSQDTYYYKDFNVWGSGSHQYATSLYDQASKGISLKSACISNPYAALTFRIPVYADMAPTAYAAPTGAVYNPAQPVQTRRKGDYDGDGQITVKELATIRMYLLGVKPLSVEERSYVDVSGDNDVTVKDLALVRMYLLGLISL